MICWEQDPKLLHWAEDRLGFRYDPKQVTWLTSLSKEGIIRGVVIFSRFTVGNCEVSVAGEPGWVTKEFALAVAGYVWGQLEQRRVTAIIAAGNQKSLNLAAQLGFRVEGELREWYPTGDATILGLLRKDCKFWGRLNGRTAGTHSA